MYFNLTFSPSGVKAVNSILSEGLVTLARTFRTMALPWVISFGMGLISGSKETSESYC